MQKLLYDVSSIRLIEMVYLVYLVCLVCLVVLEREKVKENLSLILIRRSGSIPDLRPRGSALASHFIRGQKYSKGDADEVEEDVAERGGTGRQEGLVGFVGDGYNNANYGRETQKPGDRQKTKGEWRKPIGNGRVGVLGLSGL